MAAQVSDADTGAEGEANVGIPAVPPQKDINMIQWLKQNRLNKFIDYFEENGLIIDDLLTYDEEDINSVIEDCKITAHAYKKKFKNAVRKLQFESSKKKDIKTANINQIHPIIISSKESETMRVLELKLADINISLKQVIDGTSQLSQDTQKTDSDIENTFKSFRNKLNEREKWLRNKLHEESNKQMNILKETQNKLKGYKKSIADGLSEQNTMIIDPDLDSTKREMKITQITNDIVKSINENDMKMKVYPISFMSREKKVMEYISSICMVSAQPIPVLLSIDGSKNPIKLKWKLQNYEEQKQQNENRKIKVEWTRLDANDDDEKEMKLDFDNNKSFDVKNYNNNENEILLNIANKKGKYFFRLSYFDLHSWSVQSNIKSIENVKKRMSFYTEKHGDDLEFINGNIVKHNNNGYWRTCLFGEEINDTMCNEFNIYIKCNKGSPNGHLMMGYINSTIQNSVKQWNDYLGSSSNPQNCVAYFCDSNHFRECINGKDTTLNYKAKSNFKEGDTFKLSFNFGKNQLIIYHNGTKAETLPLLDNCKKFTFAICTYYKDREVEITNYELL